MLQLPSLSLCLAVAALVVAAVGCGSSDSTGGSVETPDAEPPVAEVIPHETEIHGRTLTDDYFWLRERDDPKVIAYLEAENAYAEAMTSHTQELQKTLYDEMVGRIKETDLSVPYLLDGYYYYSRTEEGKQYSIYCRKKGSLEAEEEVLLDGNELAEGHEYFSLAALEVSPNTELLAYSVDTDGSELFSIRIKNLATGELLGDELTGAAWGLEWGNDNATLFYTTRDEARRPYKLFRHRLGTAQGDDELIYHEEDDAFFLGVTKTKSRRFLVVNLGSSTTSEVHFLDADRPDGELRLFAPRRQEVEYSIFHHGDHFYVLTNEEAKNFKLVRTPIDSIGRDSWREEIPHRPEVRLEFLSVFADQMAVFERADGLRRIRIREIASGDDHIVEMPEPLYAVWPDANPEFDSKTLRFRYQSMITPSSIYDYDMAERSRELKKQTEVLGGFDGADYVTERQFATASDGTRIPLSLVYRKGLDKGGANPCLLYGYGSYGASMEPTFSSTRISLLDRGFVWVTAHIRGGGEMGEPWHDAGKLLTKRNTFTDFIASAEYLIAEGYTSSDKLAVMGGSAGGLLIGAVINMRPDLFEAAVAQVPFVDVINTMLDSSIPLTVIEYEEWGNPNEKEYFDYMISYSPYDNVAAVDYPDLLVTAGLNDPRVQYWEPAKWVAKLRATKTGDGHLLLKTNMGAGHGGASGRYDALEERAFEFAFVLDSLGVAG